MEQYGCRRAGPNLRRERPPAAGGVAPGQRGFLPVRQYPCAGSFVRYLIDRYGLNPLKTYFASATFEDVAVVTEARFQAAYGHTVASLWDEWRAQIR
jgi:hypothetical protein